MLNNFNLIDLSHVLHEKIPVWPGSQPFSRQLIKDYLRDGCQVFDFRQAQGIGTHIDAPAHFIPHARTIDQLTLAELIVPLCVIDVTGKVQKDPDYAISALDINAWEHQHGQLEKGCAVVAYTGWSRYWPTVTHYYNADTQGVMHFPGFAKDAAELLVSRGIVGLGIDTLSLDPGNSTTFATHHSILGSNLYQMENLTNLDKLPAKGAILFALPINIYNGSEAVARIIAILSV